MDKFRIRITAKNQKELNMRIEDNIKRGFSLVKIKNPETVDIKSKYIKSGGYNDYDNVSIHSHVKYTALMERNNQKEVG